MKAILEAIEYWICQMCGQRSIGDLCLHCGAHKPA